MTKYLFGRPPVQFLQKSPEVIKYITVVFERLDLLLKTLIKLNTVISEHNILYNDQVSVWTAARPIFTKESRGDKI